ncbi:MAG: hypothetical protein ACLQNE_35490 [Thermoguttaceae bacterium]|jgi:hypothetical protein
MFGSPPSAASGRDIEPADIGKPQGERLSMPGFRPIPVGGIGLYEDGYRKGKRGS